MLFILKKKKEKKRKRKMLVTKEEKNERKTQLTNPFCTKLEGEEERLEPGSKGPQVF